MAIEILENSLLKLIIRSGPDSDRLNVVLTRGELGYASDTKRLYVGDGSTLGGILVGNSFRGSSTTITTLAPASIGDLAYDNDNNKLYRLASNNGSIISDWELIGGVYSAGNGVTISADNVISTTSISAGKLTLDAIASPMIFDSNNRLSLSASVSLDRITPKTGTTLEIPASIISNGVTYTLPSAATSGKFLQTIDGVGSLVFGPLALSSISVKTITVTNGLTAIADGVNVTGVAVNPLSSNIVIGLSPTLSSNNIFARYNGITDTLTYGKGITSVTKLGVGNYQFNYSLPTPNLVATTQIFGLSSMTYQPRVININDVACIVRVANSSLAFTDADIFLTINS